MNIKPILLYLLAATAAVQAADAPNVKWHPGHYVFVGSSKLTPEVLTLPHFRGVQKIYTWRDIEPEMGRYDFSALKADLALVKQHGRQLVVQFTYKSFSKGRRSVPDYLTGEEYGGGVYVTLKGSFNPVIWNTNVAARFDALLAAFGREFDRDPNLEAVNLPETATSARLLKSPQKGVEPYTDQAYFAALKQGMTTLRHAFPNTVVIQYLNFPQNLLGALTDYEKEIGVGMGGPDVYPRENASYNSENGVYRLYAKLAGTVPMGAAVQVENYSVASKKRSILGRGEGTVDGKRIVIAPEDEIPIPPREHLQLAQNTLKLNYLFWAATPRGDLERVKKLLAEPDLAGNPAGGLETKIPPKAFLK
jgi:hypothetical protein